VSSDGECTVVFAARMNSSRFPGKTAVDYGAGPNLGQIIRRWQASRRSPTIVVATSDGAEDDPIEWLCLCDYRGVACFRGSRDDVVSRMDGALKAACPDAKWVARGLADNPLVDVGLADWRLDVLAESGADGVWYLGDESRITYAGTTDVFSRAAWDRLALSSSGSQREHPGAYFWDNMSKFNAIGLPLPAREYLAPVRTELDTEQDLAVMAGLWRAWRATNDDGRLLPTMWALEFLANHPLLSGLNADVPLKTQTRALWPKGSHWLCKSCNGRVGAMVAGDLEVRCGKCGRAAKFYARKPEMKKPSMGRY